MRVSFAVNKFGSRRTRTTDRKKAFDKSVELHRRAVLELVNLIDNVGDETRNGYCSACLSTNSHHLVAQRMTPIAYLCSGCGAATTPCRVPGCDHFAMRSRQRVAMARYCAEHVHAIPGFDKLDTKLKTLEEYESWLEFDSRDAKRITTMTGGLLGGALILGPLFFAAAPAIGGAIGAWTGLFGATATSHGLALLGGGAVASGGLGMAGGTAVVTAAGASLGSKLGASVASAYVGDDPSFGIELVEKGDGAPVVSSSGFLTEDEQGWGHWEPLIRARYPDRTVYRLSWGAKEKKDLRGVASREAGEKLTLKAAKSAASHASRKAMGKIGIIGGVFTTVELAKNPWWVALVRADMSGAVLADLIARTETEQFVLIGHSLGARVMIQAAQALATAESGPRLESVHLLGAAVTNTLDLRPLDASVSGGAWNYWSNHDDVLKHLYHAAQFGRRAAGANGFATTSSVLMNRNVSAQVESHSSYVANVQLQ